MKTNTTIFAQLHDLLYKSFIQLLEYSKVTKNLANLCKTAQGEVFPDIVVREIAKASHPHIGSYKNSNCIVKFSCFEVVVH